MTPAQRANLRRLLSPRHIAFVGGRDCLTAIGEAERRGFKPAFVIDRDIGQGRDLAREPLAGRDARPCLLFQY